MRSAGGLEKYAQKKLKERVSIWTVSIILQSTVGGFSGETHELFIAYVTSCSTRASNFKARTTLKYVMPLNPSNYHQSRRPYHGRHQFRFCPARRGS
jgi:hypothetical protein